MILIFKSIAVIFNSVAKMTFMNLNTHLQVTFKCLSYKRKLEAHMATHYYSKHIITETIRNIDFICTQLAKLMF